MLSNTCKSLLLINVTFLTPAPIKLLFEFNNATSIEFGIRLTQFVKADDWQEITLIELASELLLSVKTEEGVKFELGTKENIASLIKNTHPEFVRDCVIGWFYNVGVERLALKKKLAGSNGR